jgi:hypothetical protein
VCFFVSFFVSHVPFIFIISHTHMRNLETEAEADGNSDCLLQSPPSRFRPFLHDVALTLRDTKP